MHNLVRLKKNRCFLFLYIFLFLLYFISFFFGFSNDIHVIFHLALAQVGGPLEKSAARVYMTGCVGVAFGANEE